MGRGVKVEVGEGQALGHDELELGFEGGKFGGQGSVLAGDRLSVHAHAAEFHLKDRALKFALEGIGGGGDFVELGEEGLKDFEGDATVHTVVYPEADVLARVDGLVAESI